MNMRNITVLVLFGVLTGTGIYAENWNGLLDQADKLYEANKFEDARKVYEKAANQTEDLSAQVSAWGYLGQMYYNGEGVAQDLTKARGYFQKVADHTGDEQDRAEAKRLVQEIDASLKK
jgi:TPR repeat protein